MDVYLMAVAAVLVLGLIGLVALGASNRWRFGRVLGPRQIVGQGGPYRQREERTVEERGTPKTIWLASMSSVVWGVITLFIFIPAGALLAVLIFTGFGHSHGPVDSGSALAGFALVAICIDGLFLAVMLFIQAGALMQRTAAHCRKLVLWSLTHHTIVLIYFLVLGAALNEAGGFFIALFCVGIPCSAGALQAATMAAAQARLHGIETEEEHGLALAPGAPQLA